MSNEESCVGCKFLYTIGSGYSNYTWMETFVECSKDKNPNLSSAEEPSDWKFDPDNWPATNNSRCELYSEGLMVTMDVDGDNGPADFTDDEEAIQSICEHSGRKPHGY